MCSIVGEDKTLSIKLGADAGDSSTQDVILVRGATADVNRVVKEINDIVDKASKDAIVSSHVCNTISVFINILT